MFNRQSSFNNPSSTSSKLFSPTQNEENFSSSLYNHGDNLTVSSRENNSPFMIVKSKSVRINYSSQQTNQAKTFSPNINSPSYKNYTPSPNLKEKLSDRFIPCRGVNLIDRFEMTKVLENKEDDEHVSEENQDDNGDNNSAEHKVKNSKNYADLLKKNLFGSKGDFFCDLSKANYLSQSNTDSNVNFNSKLFQYKVQEKKKEQGNSSTIPSMSSNLSSIINSYKHVSTEPERKFPKVPFKILDAPGLMDDFYLNLVDWSSENDLVVGLHNSVYIWSANKSKVHKLSDYGEETYVSSVAWNPKGTCVATGTSEGNLDIIDASCNKLLRTLGGHSNRIGAIAWNSSLIATGSKDKNILIRDLRVGQDFVSCYSGHKQEVCGLKWSFDETQLASGGNDNKLFVWSNQSNQPLAKFSNHTAAVKAIAWSPHQNGLLATGGGTADRTIRFWNTNTLQQINYIDTGSQVCNLIFSKTVNEIISTHGYSLNQIICWKLPEMTKLTTLTGHTYRVLYLSMSPDGQNIVTGAGDETLRFWNMFPSTKSIRKDSSSSLFLSTSDLR